MPSEKLPRGKLLARRTKFTKFAERIDKLLPLFCFARHALSYHPTCNYGNRFRFTREKIDIFQNVPSPGVLETRMAN